MYTVDFTAVIAIALVALVLISIRISWTLKELVDAIASRDALSSRNYAALNGTKSDASAPLSMGGVHAESADAAPANAESAGPDETGIAAVIAIAHEAFRAAV